MRLLAIIFAFALGGVLADLDIQGSDCFRGCVESTVISMGIAGGVADLQTAERECAASCGESPPAKRAVMAHTPWETAAADWEEDDDWVTPRVGTAW